MTLIKYDIKRIISGNVFLVSFILSIAFPVLNSFDYINQPKIHIEIAYFMNSYLNPSGYLNISLQIFIIKILPSLFIVYEFTQGTLRNKIICGNSKRKIYFSYVLTINLIIIILQIITTFLSILIALMFLSCSINISNLILFFLCDILLIIAFVTTIVSLTISTRNIILPFLIILLILPIIFTLINHLLTFYKLNELNNFLNIFNFYNYDSLYMERTNLNYNIILCPIAYIIIFYFLGLYVFLKTNLK